MTTPIPAQEPLFEVDAELLERLMKRTKTGAPITGRELAAKAGIASGTISNLLTGVRSRVTGPTVASICDVIGVIRSAASVQCGLPDGRYVPARPMAFQSWERRWKAAWLVFTGRADALLWPGQED